MLNNVRITNLEINYLKNVHKGVIDFHVDKNESKDEISSNILSIYGANGSGKTTVINAIQIFKTLICSKKLTSNNLEIISKGHKAILKIEFLSIINEINYGIFYKIELDNNQIVHEDIAIKDYTNNTRKFHLTSFTKLLENETLKNENSIKKSIYFSKEFLKISNQDITMLLVSLKQYAYNKLFIIGNTEDYNYFIIPGDFSDDDFSNDIKKVSLENYIIEDNDKINELVNNINELLPSIINEMHLIVKEKYGKITFYTKRFDTEVKLQNESLGVKKLIYFLNYYLEAFNDSSITLICDELDSCIFEFLFGELLQIFDHYALGQLIFTSHNLRPLEVLNAKSVLFTTLNPDNKFLSSNKNKNDLRTQYYRNIILGGTKEKLYKDTDLIAFTNKIIKKRWKDEK